MGCEEPASRVSILTVTQGSRIDFLAIQVRNMQTQTYQNVIEWVIVDGSATDEESKMLEQNIPSGLRFPVRLVPVSPKGARIGRLRNIGNAACKGDIIVCVDDDDYYQPGYIAHAVECLRAPFLVAGCANVYVYDQRWQLLVQAKPQATNHTTNNCMAYRKEYTVDHSYDETVMFDEESSFLGVPDNSFDASVPIAQMDPKKAVIHMVHATNTAEKARAVLSALYDHPYCCIRTSEEIGALMPADVFHSYRACLGAKADCPYDVVYCCGMWSLQWDPSSESLGGSEQAVVQLSREWARAGLKVAVYGEVPEKVVDGVSYFPFERFHPWQRFKTLILWRYYGITLFDTCSENLEARNLFIDFHDNTAQSYKQAAKVLEMYPHTRFFFKSKYHYEQYLQVSGPKTPLKERNVIIIPNGILLDAFQKPKIPRDGGRNPFRMCYASCYTRGLVFILKHFWPIIKRMEPRAELHLYYGTDLVDANAAKEIHETISKSRGVCDHGRQSIYMVAREKHMSSFHLYLTETTAEIDCISVRESLVAGCIPVMLDTGVFKERDGIRVPLGTSFVESAKMLVDLMKDPKKCDKLRTRFAASPTITTWKQVAEKWRRFM